MLTHDRTGVLSRIHGFTLGTKDTPHGEYTGPSQFRNVRIDRNRMQGDATNSGTNPDSGSTAGEGILGESKKNPMTYTPAGVRSESRNKPLRGFKNG